MNWLLSLFVVLVVAGAPSDAHAYIDPGTGSMILQALLGGVAGAYLVIKLYWRKIRAFFMGKKAVTAQSVSVDAADAPQPPQG